MSNIAIDYLLKQRQHILDEKAKMIELFDKEISDLETAIERIEGKKVWEITDTVRYDDESPDYIRSSQEEI